jgi:PAS domain S-box-containing protein
MEHLETSAADEALTTLFPTVLVLGADGGWIVSDDPDGLVPAEPRRTGWILELLASAELDPAAPGSPPVAVGTGSPSVDGIALAGAGGRLTLRLRALDQVAGAAEADRRLAMYEAVLATGPVFVHVHDADGNSRWTTSELRSELGWSAGQASDRESNLAFVHPEDRERLTGIRATLVRNGGTARVRVRVRAADDAWHWLMITSVSLLDEPSVRGLVAHAIDITDEVEREEEVAEGRRRLSAVIDTLDEGVVVIGPSGVEFANAQASRLLPSLGPPGGLPGLAAAEMVERAARGMADPGSFTRYVRDLVAQEARVEGVVLETADARMLEHALLPVSPRGTSRPTDRVWVLRDVTARLEEEARRQRLLDLERDARRSAEARSESLQQLDRLKTEFVANVSHELRTPLSALVSYVALLREDDELTADQHEIAAKAARTAGRLARLTHDLLTYGQLEAGAVTLHDEEVDVALLVREAAADLQAMHPGRRVEVRAPAGPEVRSDRLRLAQILGNLLENAVRYSPADTPVACRAAPTGSGWEIRITDHGPGIAHDDLPRLFRPFERGAREARADAGGSGLGLAICGELARRLGGSVALESEPGSGTTAVLRVPLTRDAR